MSEQDVTRRNGGLITAAAVAAVILLVIFGWLFLVKSDSTEHESTTSETQDAVNNGADSMVAGDSIQSTGDENSGEVPDGAMQGGLYTDSDGAFSALFPSDPKVTTNLSGSSMTKSAVYQDQNVFLAVDSYRTVGETGEMTDDQLKSELLADATAFVDQLGGAELRATEFDDYQGELSLKYSFEGSGFYGHGVVTKRSDDTYNVVAMYVKDNSTAEAVANVFYNSVEFVAETK